MGAREYVTWPGQETFPGAETTPGWVRGVDDDVTEVRSRAGAVWTRVTDENIVKEATLSSALGDRPVDLSQITTTGTMRPRTAQTVAALSGQFLTLGTHQLVVSGTASIQTAVVQEIWSRIVRAQSGEFEQVTANMISAGAIDGQVITGATIQTARTGARVVVNQQGLVAYRADSSTALRITPSSMEYFDSSGERTLYTNAAGDMILAGNLDIKDSWSKLSVGDLVDPFNTFIWGAGLKWTRLDGALKTPGGIGIVLDTQNNRTGVMLQCPSGNASPQSTLTMYDDSVSMFARAGVGCMFNASAQRMFMNAGGGTYITGGYDVTTGGRTLGVVKDNGHKMEMQISGNTIFFGNGVHSNGTLTATGTKTFVMPHPLHDGKALYHASTESPWDGIEYWGTAVVGDDGTVQVHLPAYVEPIRRRDAPFVAIVSGHAHPARVTSRDRGVSFTVAGTPGDHVDWIWKGARTVPSGNVQPEGLDLPDYMRFPEDKEQEEQ